MVPESLQNIVATFADAAPEERLDILLEFALSMPDIPVELQNARDTMETVPECQTPVFLHSAMEQGKIYYHIDVPHDSPTVRGFASILREALNGATPESIAEVPNDLYQQLGLHKVLSPLRLRGLAALLYRMKRNAQELGRKA